MARRVHEQVDDVSEALERIDAHFSSGEDDDGTPELDIDLE